MDSTPADTTYITHTHAHIHTHTHAHHTASQISIPNLKTNVNKWKKAMKMLFIMTAKTSTLVCTRPSCVTTVNTKSGALDSKWVRTQNLVGHWDRSQHNLVHGSDCLVVILIYTKSETWRGLACQIYTKSWPWVWLVRLIYTKSRSSNRGLSGQTWIDLHKI